MSNYPQRKHGLFTATIHQRRDQGFQKKLSRPLLICNLIIAACALSHKKACVWYLIVFAVTMTVGLPVYKPRKR